MESTGDILKEYNKKFGDLLCERGMPPYDSKKIDSLIP